MANNLAAVIPQILAQGLLALRSNVVMPALVNSDFSLDAAEKGATIDVPIPSAIAVQDVAPAATPPATANTIATKAIITLDQWKEAPFYLSDKDLLEASNGIIPMQASEAVKALAGNVNAFIMSNYTGIYGFSGAAGVTPFASDVSEATNARKVLNNQLAPLEDRRMVIDPDAEANALGLRAFQDMSFSGSAAAIVEGRINRKLGFDWFMDQQVVSHTKGTDNGAFLINDAAHAAGVKTVSVDTGTGDAVAGDIFTVAGDAQTYTVTSIVGTAPMTSINYEPANVVAFTDDAAITFKASHVVNLAFHRDAFAFATRPLVDQNLEGMGSIVQAAVDPVSGLTLRLEVTREHKRIRYSYDILYGASMVRAPLAVRLAG